MADPQYQVEVTCPRCSKPHVARASDQKYRLAWTVECGDLRVESTSPVFASEEHAVVVRAFIASDLQKRLKVWPLDPRVYPEG